MASLVLLIPIALLLVAVAIAIYLWAINSGQYQDLDREADRILHDDQPAMRKALRQDSEEFDSEES